MRRPGEENLYVTIIFDSGADVALFSFEYGRSLGRRVGVQRKDEAGEPYLHDLDGREVLLKENVIFS